LLASRPRSQRALSSDVAERDVDDADVPEVMMQLAGRDTDTDKQAGEGCFSSLADRPTVSCRITVPGFKVRCPSNSSRGNRDNSCCHFAPGRAGNSSSALLTRPASHSATTRRVHCPGPLPDELYGGFIHTAAGEPSGLDHDGVVRASSCAVSHQRAGTPLSSSAATSPSIPPRHATARSISHFGVSHASEDEDRRCER